MSFENLPDPQKQSDGSWAVQYEIKDEKGRVVGVTTLSGPTEKSVYKKMQAAHAEGTLAIDRLRNRAQTKPSDLSTPEQEALKARKAQDYANEERESLAFLKRHLYTGDYNPCMANAQVLRSYLEAKGLPWTADNLDVAFEVQTAAGRLVPPERAKVEVAAPPVEEVPVEVPWKPFTTAKEAWAIPREEFKSYMIHKDPAIRQEFKRQLSEVGIRG
jgi:hypothetical protein